MSVEHVSQRVFVPREDGSLRHGIELPNGIRFAMDKEDLDAMDPDHSMTREQYVDKAIADMREALRRPRELGGIPKATPAFDLAIRAAVETDRERARLGLGTSAELPSSESMRRKPNL